MRFATLIVSPLVTAALVVAFGWPVLLVCFALALGTLLFSTCDAGTDAEAGESSYLRVDADGGDLSRQSPG